MKNRLSNPQILLAVAAAFTVCALARAQVDPAATGGVPKLDYSVSYSQTASFYSNNSPSQERGVLYGDLNYANGRQHSPLDLTYSGGYIFGISGPQSDTGVFQHLRLSQGYFERKWGAIVSDEVSYSPVSPTVGFSGIPGVGDLSGLPDIPNGTIVNSRTLYNISEGTFTRSLNSGTTLDVNGNYAINRYPAGAALETNALGVGPEITWRIGGLSSISLQYRFSRFSYVSTSFALDTQSIQPGYVRTWNRRFTTSVSAGPEWIRSNSSLVVPSSTGIAGSAWASYESRAFLATARYHREVSSGMGYGTEIGVHNNDASLSLSQGFGRNVSVNASGSYLKTQSLLQSGVTTAEFGGVNVARQMGRSISVSAGYTALQQSSTLVLPTTAQAGLNQVIAFSIAYHPRENHAIGK